MNKTVKIRTHECSWCGGSDIIEIEATDEQLDDWMHKHKNIQDVFPELSVGIREQLISGTHPSCWDEMWSERLDEIDE